MSTVQKETIYDRITGRIIAAMENGVIPWVRPWVVSLPCNVVSRRSYHGINILSCLAHQLDHGHTSNGYLTFNQASALGGWIRQGERGVPLVFYREVDRELKGDEPESARIFVARGYTVFNIEQAGGLRHVTATLERHSGQKFEPLEQCEKIASATGAIIGENGPSASYSLTHDEITMPSRCTFTDQSGWYSTLFHELSHWTGAPHRLNRALFAHYGSPQYAEEELVAELSAAFLCARLGIQHITQAAAYIQSWLGALRKDKRYIFTTARLATQATNFVYPQDTLDQA